MDVVEGEDEEEEVVLDEDVEDVGLQGQHSTRESMVYLTRRILSLILETRIQRKIKTMTTMST